MKPTSALRVSCALAGGGLLVAGGSGCGAVVSFNPVTDKGTTVANLFWVALAASTLVFLLVVGVLAYVLVRFRARPGEAEPPQIHGNKRLEIAWTLIPVLLLVGMFVLTLRTMGTVEAEVQGALRVQVVGHQWWWEYRYPELGVVTAYDLHVPAGTPLRLELTAADVIHSFWIPQLGWKKDAIPGKTNDMWLRVEEAGAYDGACTEYCGTQHAWMRERLVAQSPEEFNAWVERQRQPASPPRDPFAQRGQQVFLRNTCVNCHAVVGTTAAARVGPDLTHFGSRSSIGSGVMLNTPENLRRWLRDVQTVKPGALMPAYASLPDQDLQALVVYLQGLE